MEWQHGTLSPEHLDQVLRFLPVDISFADENDVLLYWKGETYKTCDARYIGRDVRDCHPENSLDCLEEILRQFKAGTKEMAEGWGRSKGKLKHTRYFAVRDRDGTYRGILEVNQDVTHIQALDGARALPGWEE